MILRAGQNVFEFPRSPLVFGSLLLGNKGPRENEEEHLASLLAGARALIEDGAEIIAIRMDLGTVEECKVGEAEEAYALCTFVKAWREAGFREPLAIETPRFHVAEMALASGVEFLFEPNMGFCAPPSSGESYARLCAKFGTALIVFYFIEGGRMNMEASNPGDEIALAEDFFEVKLRSILDEGLSMEGVVLGVHLGAETDSIGAFWMHSQLESFHRFGRPLLLSVSHGIPSNTSDGNFAVVAEREAAGMVSKMVRGVLTGVQMFCGHPIKATSEAVRTVAAILA